MESDQPRNHDIIVIPINVAGICVTPQAESVLAHGTEDNGGPAEPG